MKKSIITTLEELVIQRTYFTSQTLGRDGIIVLYWKFMYIVTKSDDETRHTKPGTAYKTKPSPSTRAHLLKVPSLDRRKSY